MKEKVDELKALLRALKDLEETEKEVINSEVSDIDNEVQELVEVPEPARPFQALSFSCQKPLTINQVMEYLDKDSEAVSEFPWKPSGGTVVLFKAKSLAHNEDWRANGHRFSQINGGRVVMNGMIRRRVGYTQSEEKGPGNPGFQMISWVHKDKPLHTLVQFVGDEKLSVDRPHGKSKSKETAYMRSAPSLIRNLEVGTEKPYKEYQSMVFNAPPDVGSQNLRVPRNVTQVRNARQRFKKLSKGTDSFNNLNRISMECEDIRFLMTVPDLIMVSVTTEMIEQARQILKINYDKAAQKQLLGYNTQFQLGYFYCSYLFIRDFS